MAFHFMTNLCTMTFGKIVVKVLCIALVDATIIRNNNRDTIEYRVGSEINKVDDKEEDTKTNALDGVYTECLFYLSYTCLQKKILLYLRELNSKSEISVLGDHVKFVKINSTILADNEIEKVIQQDNSEELSMMIDKFVDIFFDSHLLRIHAMEKDIAIPQQVEEFVGRKKRKGGGGGGHGGDDGGKKKMMMMALMCMKMKFMMVMPAMMGMMGLMSFKGMMFSMMSFMMAKMMLLMKLLEKKGSLGGGVGDGGWATSSGSAGAWMPAGGQDNGVGGYDANGQWQSRSIFEIPLDEIKVSKENKPIITYVKPQIRFNNIIDDKKVKTHERSLKDEIIKQDHQFSDKVKSRRKRGIMDVIQNTYLFWLNKVLGSRHNVKPQLIPKYRIINGVKYVFYPYKQMQKLKAAKAIQNLNSKPAQDDIQQATSENDQAFHPVITASDVNKGEIIEGPVAESRMNSKKFHNIKDTVDEAMEDNPWQ